MQIKEEKMCSFTQNGTRLQLIKLTVGYTKIPTGEELPLCKYQVRLNRKIVDTSISEYTERKIFASYCQTIVLQLKIY